MKTGFASSSTRRRRVGVLTALNFANSAHLMSLSKLRDLATSFSPPKVAAHLETRIERQFLRFRGRWNEIPEAISQESRDGIVTTAQWAKSAF